MKKFLTVIVMLVVAGMGLHAQNRLNTTSNMDQYGNQMDPSRQLGSLGNDSVEIESLAPKLYMWHIEETLGNTHRIDVDTMPLNYQNLYHLTEGTNGHYNHLGNLGSPRLSRLFRERTFDTETQLFLQPYAGFFFKRPSEMNFTNSNIPYTNLTYNKAGNKVTGEDRFKAYFSANVNKRMAFGFNFDYLYGRGYYSNQGTAYFNGGLFASYRGNRYDMHAMYNNFYLKQNENGGITDDEYIKHPENMAQGKKEYETNNIPVVMESTANRNHNATFYLTHRYKVGFERRIIKPKEDAEQADKGASLPSPSNAGKRGPAKAPADKGPAPANKAPAPAANEPDKAPDRKDAENQKPDNKPLPDVAKLPTDSVVTQLPAENTEQPAENAETTQAPASEPAAVASDVPMDTIYEYVPVTSFIHTLKIERSRHSFRSGDEGTVSYPYSYYDETATVDSTVAFSVKNVLGVALLEGFNKYAKAGLTAYVSHRWNHYTLMNADTTLLNPKNQTYNEQEVFLGGELAKREGQTLHYNFNGEFGLMKEATGQFRLNGNADLNLPFMKDTLRIYARARVSKTLPTFYMRHYHSNHFMWDNDGMEKEFRVRLEGEIDNPGTGTNLRAGLETVKNYTYFDASALPAQWGENIKVADVTLTQNFRLGIFHLDNEITWQKSSNQDVLPLPAFNFYHNLYLLTKIAKQVLTVQIGADVRYFSKYNAPAYTPAIEQFHLQDPDASVAIGGYPIVNVYANLQLKRTRIFIMMHHVNAGMGNKNYFLSPHYPMNQNILKFGVSWNFYD